MSAEIVQTTIRKLLLHARSADGEEAQAFLHRARELMARHGFSDGDFVTEGALARGSLGVYSARHYWCREVATALAQARGCTAAWYGTELCVIGQPRDVRDVQEVFTAIVVALVVGCTASLAEAVFYQHDPAFRVAHAEFFFGNFTEALVRRLRLAPPPAPHPMEGMGPVKFDLREAEERAKGAVQTLDDYGRFLCAQAIEGGRALGENVRLGGLPMTLPACQTCEPLRAEIATLTKKLNRRRTTASLADKYDLASVMKLVRAVGAWVTGRGSAAPIERAYRNVIEKTKPTKKKPARRT